MVHREATDSGSGIISETVYYLLEMIKLRILVVSAASLLFSVSVGVSAQNAQLATGETSARVESLLKQMEKSPSNQAFLDRMVVK